MRAFDNAQNFVIHTLSQTENRTPDVNGFKLLQDHVVTGATHNSGERYDAPKCHPKTRTAVLTSIKSWVDSSNNREHSHDVDLSFLGHIQNWVEGEAADSSKGVEGNNSTEGDIGAKGDNGVQNGAEHRNDTKPVMWLHGPAGAGKSAIAQTTANDCDKEGKLVASFFFSRLAGRNNKNGLIATIAYQLCVSIPAVKEHIINNIERNPRIFEADIKTQIQWLVVQPLGHVHHDSSISVVPRLVIIDGLDECETKRDQVEIIEAFTTSLSLVHSDLGLRVLLVSRPELEIRRAFNNDSISTFLTIMVLDDSFDPDKDIELYLRSHFQTIKRQHTLGRLFPHSWPSDDSIQTLVSKSSGQFIYASTVIHFVSDPEHDPRRRLDTILQIRPAENNDKPYAQLDALYSAVLSICKDYTKVAGIFEAIMFMKNKSPTDNMLKSIEDLEMLLSLEDEIMLLVANLHSIVDVNNVEKNGIRFYHASLFDYLADSSRSHAYYIVKLDGHVHLSIKCLQFLLNVRSGFSSRVVNFCLDECFVHFLESGWDDRVSDYICRSCVLKPGNAQLEEKLPTSVYRSGGFDSYWMINEHSHISMLSRLIGYTERREDVKRNVRDVIDAEFLNHIELYPRQEIIYVLFFEALALKGGSTVAYTLHTNFMKTFKPGYLSIMRFEIFRNQKTHRWFLRLMNDTGYINKVPEDIPIKAVYCLLDLAMEENRMYSKEIKRLLWYILVNLPLSRNTSHALLEKWTTVKNVLLNVYNWDDNLVSKIEPCIKSYCQRVEDANLNSDRGKTSLEVCKDILKGVKGLLLAWKKKVLHAK